MESFGSVMISSLELAKQNLYKNQRLCIFNHIKMSANINGFSYFNKIINRNLFVSQN